MWNGHSCARPLTLIFVEFLSEARFDLVRNIPPLSLGPDPSASDGEVEDTLPYARDLMETFEDIGASLAIEFLELPRPRR